MGRRRATAILLGAAAILSIALAPAAAMACDCSGPREPFEELATSAQVFEAELLYELPRELNSSRCPWQVKMLRAWKGTTTKKDEPVVNDCWCAKTGLEAGKRYIFYTHGYGGGSRNISMCSRVVPTDKAELDLAELGEPKDVRDPSQPLPVGPPPKKSEKAATKPLRKWQPLGLPSCTLAAVGSRPSATPYWLLALLGALVLTICTRRTAEEPTCGPFG